MKKILAVLLSTLLLLLPMAGCGSSPSMTPDTPVMEVAGETITYAEYAYTLLSYKSYYSDQGEDFWQSEDGKTLATYILAYTEGYLSELCGMKIWAKQLGVELTDEDLQLLEDNYQYTLDYYGTEQAMSEALAENACTPELFRSMMQDNLLLEKLVDYVAENLMDVTDQQVQEYADQLGYVTVQHILIRNDEGDDSEDNLALASSLRERAANGEDFLELVTEYSEDSAEYFESGYTFGTDNSMMPAFSEAALALEVGEVSEVVPIDDWYSGYHIIKRVELDSSSIRSELENQRFYELFDAAVGEQLTPTYLNNFDALDFTEVVFIPSETSAQSGEADAGNDEQTGDGALDDSGGTGDIAEGDGEDGSGGTAEG